MTTRTYESTKESKVALATLAEGCKREASWNFEKPQQKNFGEGRGIYFLAQRLQ